MEVLAYSESFYILSSIALGIVAILAIVFLLFGIVIANRVRRIVTKVDEQTTKISADIDDVRANFHDKAERFGGILGTLMSAFVVKKAVTRKKTKTTNKKKK